MVFPIFLTCGPNQVLVLSGLGYDKPVMLTGGRVVAFCCLHRWRRMSLNVMTLIVESQDVYTSQGVPISVSGVAQVKISNQHPDVLEKACEHFLGIKEHDVRALVTETLEGHQRAILGSMTVEEIFKDRKQFNERVFEVASKDLCSMGLQVLSYTIRDVTDRQGYLQALGMSRTAEVKRDARIGEAMAQKDANIQKALLDEELQKVQYANNTLIAEAQRDFMLQKANFDQEVAALTAEAELAYELQSCKTKQKIKEETMETQVVERKGMILVQEQEIHCKEKQLHASVKYPADAEKFRMETLATAERKKTVLEAEAQAEAKRLHGEAESFAVEAMAKAESVTLEYKAEAFKEYQEAAKLDMYLKALPQLVGTVGSSLSNVKSVKMVSSGDSEVGALKLSKEVMAISTNIPDLVKGMTGVDLAKSIRAA